MPFDPRDRRIDDAFVSPDAAFRSSVLNDRPTGSARAASSRSAAYCNAITDRLRDDQDLLVPGARLGPHCDAGCARMIVIIWSVIGCYLSALISSLDSGVFDVANAGFRLRRGRVISSASPTHREPIPLSLPPFQVRRHVTWTASKTCPQRRPPAQRPRKTKDWR